jgi:hypothetical protein
MEQNIENESFDFPEELFEDIEGGNINPEKCVVVFTDINCNASQNPGLSIEGVDLSSMKLTTLTSDGNVWLDEQTGKNILSAHIGELINRKTGAYICNTFIPTN